jgi:LacI family transcriptional regulator
LKSVPGRRRATLREVAAAVGVSAMTVSNFVNGRFDSMSEETRARLEDAVARLNYRPHSSGRGLRTAARLSIGMIILDESPTFLADPFITQVVAGLSNALNQHAYGLVLQGLTSREFSNSRLIRDLRTDGICVMLSGAAPERNAILDILLGLHEPIVLFQEPAPSGATDLCAIRQDDRCGGQLLTRHVLDCGARRLLFMRPSLTWPAILERLKGVRDTLKADRGEGTVEVLHCGDGGLQEAEAILGAYVRKHGFPDALMGGNDQLGIAALKLVLSRGRRAPEDVLVTGFNAFEFWRYTEPLLTTVPSPAYELGARGGAEIVERLRTGVFAAREIVFPLSLRVGGSTRRADA